MPKINVFLQKFFAKGSFKLRTMLLVLCPILINLRISPGVCVARLLVRRSNIPNLIGGREPLIVTIEQGSHRLVNLRPTEAPHGQTVGNGDDVVMLRAASKEDLELLKHICDLRGPLELVLG